jgi:hypothetical protein
MAIWNACILFLEQVSGDSVIALVTSSPDGRVAIIPRDGVQTEVITVLAEADWTTMKRVAEEYTA